MLADRVRMGGVRDSGFPDSEGFLYNYGNHSEQWFVGYRDTSLIVLTEYDEYLSIKNTGDFGNKTGAWSTIQKVDFTNKTTLKAYMEVIKTSGMTDFFGRVAIGTKPDTIYYASDKVASINASLGLTTVTLDVSSLVGEYYISVYLYAGAFPGAHVGELKLMQMWLD